MADLHIEHGAGRDALVGALDRLEEVVGRLDDRDLLAASRCHGWTLVDVVVHVRTGLQEMLGGITAPSSQPPDHDAASYWRDYADTDDEVDAILWTRRTASAYRRPSGALEHLRMAVATVRNAVAGMTEGPVSFQGHVLDSGDFLSTWAVEVVVHHLDLGRDVAVGPPTPASTRLARRTVEALADASMPSGWSDDTCVLLGAGRRIPDDRERAEAGPLADRLPVLG